MSAKPIIEFFFSPGSRYSYLAASQIGKIEAETGCTVDWRPVDGRDIRALRGHDPFVGPPVSGQYDWDYRRYDAELWADYYGIPFREPPSHDIDFKLLSRAATVAKRLGGVQAYGWRLCAAVYGSDAWPLDEALCLRLAGEVGLSGAQFAALLADPEAERQLSETAQEAYRRGAFGVPTFFAGDQMFWGNDRIVILKHVLAKTAARSRP